MSAFAMVTINTLLEQQLFTRIFAFNTMSFEEILDPYYHMIMNFHLPKRLTTGEIKKEYFCRATAMKFTGQIPIMLKNIIFVKMLNLRQKIDNEFFRYTVRKG